MGRIITLTTDFGLADGFVGTMKGVILSINPNATIVDITHDIAPQNVEQGAFLFANAAKYFPADTIHVVVVDPGVGSARREIALEAGEAVFVAPDNGVLSLAIDNRRLEMEYSISNPQSLPHAVHLTKPAYWLPRVSNTFHGRDIFAPVAAHLSVGVPLQALGDAIEDWVQLPSCAAAFRAGDEIVGRVVHIDRFGNVITDIDEGMLVAVDRTRINVRIARRQVHGIKGVYVDAASGQMIALIGSGGQLEVALRDGNAAAALGARIGDEVILMLDID
jgi:S-adenosyl-L-methionine hydrolase (adenosine-forming)